MSHYKGYRIGSARLPGWDYTAGWYFISICTHQRRPFLGAIADGTVQLSPVGAIVAEEWERTPIIRPYVAIDAWVIMPDHFHSIIAIYPHGAAPAAPPGPSVLQAGSLGAIVGQWKPVSTKRARAAGHADVAWQSRFYDVIIRGGDAGQYTPVHRRQPAPLCRGPRPAARCVDVIADLGRHRCACAVRASPRGFGHLRLSGDYMPPSEL